MLSEGEVIDPTRMIVENRKIYTENTSILSTIMKKRFPENCEIFEAIDHIVIVASLFQIEEIENYMNKGIEEERQKNKEGEETLLNKDELNFLVRL